MKKILIVVFLLSLSLSIHSQNDLGKSDDAARIVLNTFVPDDILENAPSARKLFVTKLGQIASRNGMGGGGASGNNRFIISGDINIFIGPEGGFNQDEVLLLKKQNCTNIQLGKRILRTETAPLAIIAILQYKYGDFA